MYTSDFIENCKIVMIAKYKEFLLLLFWHLANTNTWVLCKCPKNFKVSFNSVSDSEKNTCLFFNNEYVHF